MGDNVQSLVSSHSGASSRVEPPVLDTLIVDGQPQFGVFKRVGHINYLDYHSHLISQKPVAKWRKQFKANQFAFIQVVHAPYRICMAIATIKLASSAFAYIYNDESGEFEIVEGLTPLTMSSMFNGDHQQGVMSFKSRRLTITMQFEPDQVGVSLHSSLFDINATLSRGENPLTLCSPSGRRGWTFTQKEPFNRVAGTLVFRDESTHSLSNDRLSEGIVFDNKTHANLDWTLGYMRHETNWFWACINSKLDDNTRFMLNLSMGVNETGASENACWIDGDIYYLPPVMFRREAVEQGLKDMRSGCDSSEVWNINNQQLGWSKIEINLTFTPLKAYQKTDNYGVIASIFEQWIGHYSGTIRLPDKLNSQQTKVIRLNKVMGLAEDHFAKW